LPDVTEPYTPGTPCWADLIVPDQQAALDFYRDLFGWQGEIGPPETGGYSVCTLHGKPVAGIMKAMNPDGSIPDPAPPVAWTTYLASRDVDAALGEVADGGGQVMMPAMDVMTLGRMAVVADPAGAGFGLWQARDFPGAGIVNEPGAIVWNELNTADRDAVSPFYSRVAKLTTGPMEGADDYFSLSAGDRVVGGLQDLTAMRDLMPDAASHWLPYFASDDTDSTVDTLVRAGGSVVKPPYDMIAGRMSVVRDPQGALFAVIATVAPAAA